MKPAPFVSVIIPCRNEASYLGPCLDSILGCGYPPERMEVLVADGSSEDGTRELIRNYQARDARVRLIDNPRRITPVGLNLSIAAARGAIIARLDAHSTVLPGYLSRAVESLAATGAANVGGIMHTSSRDRGLFSAPIRIALSSRFGVGNSAFRTRHASDLPRPAPVDTVFGGCWPREIFARLGGFNEHLERSQDIEFNQRIRHAGGTILLTPEMQSVYYARATLGAFLRHNWINGIWAILPFAYCRVIPVRWRHLIPLAFVMLACISIAAGFPAAVLGPYLGVSLVASIGLATRRRRPSLVLLLPIAFAGLHLAYGAGSLWGAAQLPWILLRNDTESSALHPIL